MRGQKSKVGWLKEQDEGGVKKTRGGGSKKQGGVKKTRWGGQKNKGPLLHSRDNPWYLLCSLGILGDYN